jgi:hypothetical protein
MTLPVGSITSALAVTSALPCCVHGAKRQQPKQSINAVLHLMKKTAILCNGGFISKTVILCNVAFISNNFIEHDKKLASCCFGIMCKTSLNKSMVYKTRVK